MALIRRILHLTLIVDVRQKIAVLKIRVQLLRVPEVLCGDDARLHEICPRAGAQQRLCGVTEPVAQPAGLELRDAVVLAAKGDEVVHGRLVASLDVAAQELAALREP